MLPKSFRSWQSQALARENSVLGVLGLFPFLDDSGGIQRAGRVAWEGIVNRESPTANGESAKPYLFCYGAHGSNERLSTKNGHDVCPSKGEVVYTASRVQAIIAAAQCRRPVSVMLVWHVALLKLLPFFHLRTAKTVLFLHGIESWKGQDWLTRILLRRVDLFLSNSDYTWDRFLSHNPELKHARHKTVHLGIASPIRGAPPEVGSTPVALMISRLARNEDYKGHKEIIAAWPLVLEYIPSAELWIVGDGDLLNELRDIVKSVGLANRIRFLGHVSEDEKNTLLARCRCLVLPSRSEGFGLVYLEAMRIGRPCLVSTLDAGREVVNPPEAGLAVDPDSSQLLAEAVCRLLTSGPEWNLWSMQARRRYEDYFTGRHFQERHLQALEI
jgi:glycosyltransferase involved in cell wall biosynthesis